MNFESLPVLTLLIILPLIGSLFIFLIKGNDESAMRNAFGVALSTSLITFFVSIIMWIQFDGQKQGYQFEEIIGWISRFHSNYHLGIDGLSVFFVLLTTFLIPICILVSWGAIEKRFREYMICFLVLESLLIGMFCALDLILFYVFFEAVLIPMFLIIGIWGGERRIYASFKFFLYTLVGSLLMLVAIFAIYSKVGTTDIVLMDASKLGFDLQKWLWLGFFVSFAVKMPMWPVHTWLPDAHVEAPTAGSVILAGILLKMGGYGFLRFSIPLFPEASIYFAPLVYVLSGIAIIYTSLVAMVQTDMKKLIAYSSIAHMGFVTLGIFSFNQQASVGAVFQMISHGLVSGALFLCVGVLYERYHTRQISQFGGMARLMPIFAVMFLIFSFATVGLPGTSGFVGEFLVLVGMFSVSKWATFFAAFGVILSAVYGLGLFGKMMYGPLKTPPENYINQLDLRLREKLVLMTLGGFVLFFGIYPQPIIAVVNTSVQNLLDPVMSIKKRSENDQSIEQNVSKDHHESISQEILKTQTTQTTEGTQQ